MCLVGVDTHWVVNRNSSAHLERLSSIVDSLVFVQCSTGGFVMFADSSEGSVYIIGLPKPMATSTWLRYLGL